MRIRLLVLALAWVAASANPARAEVRARVFSADELRGAALAHPRKDVVRVQSQSGHIVDVALTPDVVEIRNPFADDRFHPLSTDMVRDALAELSPWISIDVQIYLLPGLPLDVGRSFTRGSEVFVAAGLGPWAPEVAAYTIIHELGHVVLNQRIPDRRGLVWERYRQLRDIDSERFHAGALHRDRPQEIFAEDFRGLFGGALAIASRTIENPDLEYPNAVAGLREYFEDLVGGKYARRPAMTMLLLN